MADSERKYTLEEVRHAFICGAAFQHTLDREAFLHGKPIIFSGASFREARRLYPCPKKLRELNYNGTAYRLKDGVLQFCGGDVWSDSMYTADLVRIIADLVDHPYEDDES